MPFTQSCLEYVRRNLLVLPYYGCGWIRKDTVASPEARMDKLGPEQFHVRVDEFFNCDNQPVGLGGIIMEKEHPFDGYHCVCCLRMVDGYDFTTKPGDYLVWIARTKPCVQPNLQKAIFEWVTFDKFAPYICGYGTVAESVQWI